MGSRVVLKRAEGSAHCVSKECSDEEMQQLRSALMMPEAGTASMKIDGASCPELQRTLEGRQQAMLEANDRWLQQVLAELGLRTDLCTISDDAINSMDTSLGDQSSGTQRRKQLQGGSGGG